MGKKFAIWGIGIRGQRVIECLGTELIEVIVENNKDLVGTLYKGILIVDKEQYIENYSNVPIFITPRGYQYELCKSLRNRGVYAVFTYNEFIDLSVLYHQVPKEILNGYSEIHILGYNAFVYILLNWCSQYGVKCELILRDEEYKRLETKNKECIDCPIKSLSSVLEKKELIIKLSEINELEERMLNQNYKIILNWNNYVKNRGEFDRIKKFRNIHKNERCFIVATGPSLRKQDLEKIYSNNVISISMNGIFKIFPDVSWRPQYYLLQDPMCLTEWKENILDMDVNVKMFSDWAWNFSKSEITENMYQWNLKFPNDGDELPPFSEDFSEVVYCAGSVVYDCIQLAIYMGIKEIYLLGTDCDFSSDINKQHFVENYVSHPAVKTQSMMSSYLSAKRYADSHGIKIYNATRGGKLEVFERKNLDEVLLEIENDKV